MAWIESHQSLAGHPKVRRLAKRLSVGAPTAIGHLHCLWWWALDYAPTGVLSDHDAEEIAIGAQWEGDPEALLDALVASKFVDNDDEDESYLELHDWHEYAGKLLLSRRAGERGNHKRWHVDRGITDPKCRFCIAPDSGTSVGGESTHPTQPTVHTQPNPPTGSGGGWGTSEEAEDEARRALTKFPRSIADEALEILNRNGIKVKNPVSYVIKTAERLQREKGTCSHGIPLHGTYSCKHCRDEEAATL